MFWWKERSIASAGSVLFRGTLPPRLEEFTQLAAARVDVRPVGHGSDAHWAAELRHPDWGTATAVCLREYTAVPRELVQFDPRLDDDDRIAATSARSSVTVQMDASRQNVLRDRKLLLRFLRCLMGDDGLIAVDHLAQKFWTREALDDELVHDADLDIDSLFVTHLVHDGTGDAPRSDDGEPPHPYWLHTHGLAELGAFDFDVLRPAPLIIGTGYETIRAIAYLLLEGTVGPATERFEVIIPGGEVSFVAVEDFNRHAAPDDVALRDDPSDPVHNSKRLVLCDPIRRGLLSRMFGGGRVRPSRVLSQIDDDHMMAPFTSAATDLMADRARRTFDRFKALSEEFAEFQVTPLAKLGFPVDDADGDGDGGNREHMWFEVHAFDTDSIDATLLNEPFHVARLHAGDRGRHALDLVTDWTIMTPAGSITPRETAAARRIRAHRDELRELLARAARENPE